MRVSSTYYLLETLRKKYRENQIRMRIEGDLHKGLMPDSIQSKP